MNVFKNTKTMKKFILVIVFLILFNVCYPKQVHAAVFDFAGNISNFIFFLERGVIKTLNNIFCDDNHQYNYDKDGEGKDTIVYLSPETIIKGKFALLNPNIFEKIDKTESNSGDPSKDKYYDVTDSGGMDKEADGSYKEDGKGITAPLVNGKNKLRDIISGWYYALRNLAIVALLSILVYVGIRMMMTSVSQDKAKYKVMLKDWVVSLCLLMVMHFIMVGVLNLSSMIVSAIGTTGQNANLTEKSMRMIQNINDDKISDGDNHEVKLDANGYANTEGQSEYYDASTEETYDIGDAYAQELMLLGIIVYTVIFAIKYLMREMLIIFLILLAPITSITYAIDKISDGKAQAFNMWFQEFLYNVIIQPFHLLIYVVLIGSATTLANTNVLYGIMCFAVMLPAEKFIKQMFGFKDKLGSPLGAFAGGALASQLANAAKNAITKKTSGSNGTNGKGENDSTEIPANTREVNNRDLIDGESSESGGDIQETNSGAYNDIENRDEGVNTQELGGGEENKIENTNEGVNTQELGGGEENEIEDTNEGVNTQELGDEEENKTGNTVEEANSEKTDSTAKSNKSKGKFARLNSVAQQRMAKRYGTTNKLKRNLKRAGRLTKAVGKAGLKTGAVLGAATLLTMTGQGGKATALVASSAGIAALRAGQRAITGARGAIKDYHRGSLSDKAKEKYEWNKFSSNRKKIDDAVKSYSKNHNGNPPNNKELDQELRDRFILSRYGLSDEEIDNALPAYQERLPKLEQKYDKQRAEEIAGSQAKYEAKYAKWYSPKDFADEKKMGSALELMKEELSEATGIKDDKVLDASARQYLTNAAKMHGVKKIALPKQTIKAKTQRKLPNSLDDLGISQSQISEEQIQRVQELEIQLEKEGFDPAQINQLAGSAANSRINSEGVIKNYENIVQASIEYKNNTDNDADIEKLVRGKNSGGDPTKAQINAEKNERFVLRTTLGIKDEKDISAIRQMEELTFNTKTDKQIARDYFKANKSAIKNGKDMSFARKQLEDTLKEKANLSPDQAKKSAERIHNFATGIYNDPSKKEGKK